MCPGLPWGVVASLPRSIQTLVVQLGVDRKSLSIIDATMRGTIHVVHAHLHDYVYVYDNGACLYMHMVIIV